MNDVVAARQAIRDAVEPLQLRCRGYHVYEQLGRARGEDWLDDDYTVFVQAEVYPDEGFPIQEYEDNRWRFKVGGRTREQAMRGLQSEVEAKVPTWKKLLARDAELRKLVGRRIRAMKADTHFNEDVLKAEYEAHGDLERAQTKARIDVDRGDEFEVVAHKPGKVKLSSGFWVSTWRFDNCLLGPGDQRTPDPYFEVVSNGR